MEQQVISKHISDEFQAVVKQKSISKILLICGENVGKTAIGQYFTTDNHVRVVFSDFEPNPSYESVVKAVNCFQNNQCDAIMAIGGGSAMDVGKCVKAFLNMDSSISYLEQKIIPNAIPYLVIPTTAGTGSEATKFAVIYEQEEKKSVEDESLIPEYVFLDRSLMETLPLFQKKVTMMDALCHSIESFWANGATEESRKYSKQGLTLILKNYREYLKGNSSAAKDMLIASNYAGRAINIAKTTAAHAMSYKLTKIYELPHGQAAANCLSQVWEYTWIQAQKEKKEDLLFYLQQLAELWRTDSICDSIQKYRDMLKELEITVDVHASKKDLEILTQSVNVERLKNHPVFFSKNIIGKMYYRLLEGDL
jgi:alcohol dehydrogenase class IV